MRCLFCARTAPGPQAWLCVRKGQRLCGLRIPVHAQRPAECLLWQILFGYDPWGAQDPEPWADMTAGAGPLRPALSCPVLLTGEALGEPQGQAAFGKRLQRSARVRGGSIPALSPCLSCSFYGHRPLRGLAGANPARCELTAEDGPLPAQLRR